jgi:DNA-binding response OmpR family regulator
MFSVAIKSTKHILSFRGMPAREKQYHLPGIVNVLVVEPDPGLMESLVTLLSKQTCINIVASVGYIVEALTSTIQEAEVDVAIVNLDHPEMHTMDSWAMLRLLLPQARVVALTEGRNDLALKIALCIGVSGLHRFTVDPIKLSNVIIGAAHGNVDYDPLLVETVRNFLAKAENKDQVNLIELSIDLDKERVCRWGKPIYLTPLEFRILAHLSQAEGKPVPPSELLRSVWSATLDTGGTMDQVKSCVKRLRKKIEPNVKHSKYLLSIKGHGYLL